MDTQQDLLIAPYGKTKDNEPNQPNPTQTRVLDWIYDVCQGQKVASGIPVLYLQGGARSGKTRGILAGVIQLLLEIDKLRALWGRQDFNDLRLSSMELFFEVMPTEVIVDKNVQEHRFVIGQPNGGNSQIFFRELKDLGGLGSQEYGLIVVTECHEISENAFRTLKIRCSQANMPSMILMEGNPPNSDHWLYRFTNPKDPDFDPDITFWRVSAYENWNNLSLAYKNSLESMPPSWKKKFIEGEFGFIPDGRAYYEGYLESIHKRSLSYTQGFPLHCGWDFGYNHPAFIVTQYVPPHWNILWEIMGNNMSINTFADSIVLPLLSQKFPDATSIHYGDPACNQRNDKSEQTTFQILLSKGILIHSKPSEYRLRKEIIDRLLNSLTKGVPHLLVNTQCEILNDGFLGGYHYPMYDGQKQFVDKYSRPFHDDYYSHICNSLEYIAVHLFNPVTQKETREEEELIESRSNI